MDVKQIWQKITDNLKEKTKWDEKSGQQKKNIVLIVSISVMVGAFLFGDSIAAMFGFENQKPIPQKRPEDVKQTEVIRTKNKDLTLDDFQNMMNQFNNRLDRVEMGNANGLSKEEIINLVNSSQLAPPAQGAGADLPPDVTEGSDPQTAVGKDAVPPLDNTSGLPPEIAGAMDGTSTPAPANPADAGAPEFGGTPPSAVEGAAAAAAGGQQNAKRNRLGGFSNQAENTGADKEKTPVKNDAETAAYIPSGSIFRVVSITGLNAPTSEQAQKTPMPVLFRVKGMTNLPNRYQSDLNDCFIQGVGYGQMADERILIRTTGISCMNEHGQALEAGLDGTFYGEDGKVGIRGRMVSKTGQVIANMLKVVALQVPSQILVNAASNLETRIGSKGAGGTNVTLNAGQGGGNNADSSASDAVGNAFNRIVGIYEQQAQQMFPVIEANPGRSGTITVMNGFKLKVATGDNKK